MKIFFEEHPTDEQIAGWLDRGLPPDEDAAVERHLTRCARCHYIARTAREIASEEN